MFLVLGCYFDFLISQIQEKKGHGNSQSNFNDDIDVIASQERNESKNDIDSTSNSSDVRTSCTSGSAESSNRTDISGILNKNMDSGVTEADIRGMSISQLRKLSGQLSISIATCLYKEDIIDKILASGNICTQG